MTEELLNEPLITINAATKLIPGRPSLQTGYRYVSKGVRGADGQTHRLESLKSCGQLWTSSEAVQRFVRAINQQPHGAPTVTPSQRASQNAAAKQILAAR